MSIFNIDFFRYEKIKKILSKIMTFFQKNISLIKKIIKINIEIYEKLKNYII